MRRYLSWSLKDCWKDLAPLTFGLLLPLLINSHFGCFLSFYFAKVLLTLKSLKSFYIYLLWSIHMLILLIRIFVFSKNLLLVCALYRGRSEFRVGGVKFQVTVTAWAKVQNSKSMRTVWGAKWSRLTGANKGEKVNGNRKH